MKPKSLALLVFTALIITACASPAPGQSFAAQPSSSGEEQSSRSAQTFAPVWEQTVQVDEQGAVVMQITPLNLNSQGDLLEFEIALNTHSVDLSMDLAKLATLTTDAGMTVNATSWEAPRGGHHVSGKLLFPSHMDGESILEGTTNITVQIRDVDAALRSFVWGIQ